MLPGDRGDRMELVSCVMATKDRPAFARQALRCFLRQTYSPAELIVVDDGKEPVEDVFSGVPGVRYLRLQDQTSTGNKLNLGIAFARGSVIQKLDDDDYYHPDFLAWSVNALGRSSSLIAAWDCFLVLLRGEPVLRFSGYGYA